MQSMEELHNNASLTPEPPVLRCCLLPIAYGPVESVASFLFAHAVSVFVLCCVVQLSSASAAATAKVKAARRRPLLQARLWAALSASVWWFPCPSSRTPT